MKHHQTKGFSLLELAVIVLILGMITTLLWPLVNMRIQQRKTVAVHSQLERADWTLTGYVMAHARLPCPDTDGDGRENCAAAANVIGALPYEDLGIADATARQIRYGVLRRAAEVPDLEVTDEDPAPSLPRSGELTVSRDRFYPLLTLLDADPNEGGVGPAFATDPPRLPLLETNGGLYGGPVVGTYIAAHASNHPFGVEDALDFCWALRVVEDEDTRTPEEVGQLVHMLDRNGGNPRQIAYGLALPADPAYAIDHPPPADPAFQAPDNFSEERVRAVTPGMLWHRLSCGEAMASIGHAQPNAATAAVILYRGLFDYEQALEQSYALEKGKFLGSIGSLVTAGTKSIFYPIAETEKAAGKALAALPMDGGVLSDADLKKLADVVTITGKLIATEALAISQTAVAALKVRMSYEKREMAGQRYTFAQGLRATAKSFAEQLLKNTRFADKQGVYSERFQYSDATKAYSDQSAQDSYPSPYLPYP